MLTGGGSEGAASGQRLRLRRCRGRCFLARGRVGFSGLFAWILRHHQSWVPEEALARWPNGIRASVELNAPFTRLPRWPYQLLFFARSICRFAVRGLSAGAQ